MAQKFAEIINAGMWSRGMTRPNFDGRISLGNVLTIIGMVAGAVFIWSENNADVRGALAAVEAVADDVERNGLRIDAHGERLRVVENGASRQSATLDLILQELTELNTQLRALQERVAR